MIGLSLLIIMKLLTFLCSSQVTPLQGRFSEVHHLLTAHGITASSVDAVLFDLGASSMQFDTPARGFSISGDGPLDMRMDSDRYNSQYYRNWSTKYN